MYKGSWYVQFQYWVCKGARGCVGEWIDHGFFSTFDIDKFWKISRQH